MNKLLSSTLACTLLTASVSAFAGTTVQLPTNNTIAAKSSVEIPLDGLNKDTTYVVSCNVDSSSPNTLQLSVAPHLAKKSGFGIVKMNGKSALKNVGSLEKPHNTLTFLTSVAKNDGKAPNGIIINNLDDKHVISINSCEAKPASNTVAKGGSYILGGGYFYVSNPFPYFLDILVGDYSPTPYCIYPYLTQLVETSTSYQNINIVGTHY